MSAIKSIVNTNGVVTSWEEYEKTFSVTYLNGKPSIVKSRVGRWPDQECAFTYNANGDFTGISGELNTQLLNHLIALASGMITSSKTLTGRISLLAGTDEVISSGTDAPNDSDGKLDGSIYFQI